MKVTYLNNLPIKNYKWVAHKHNDMKYFQTFLIIHRNLIYYYIIVYSKLVIT